MLKCDVFKHASEIKWAWYHSPRKQQTWAVLQGRGAARGSDSELSDKGYRPAEPMREAQSRSGDGAQSQPTVQWFPGSSPVFFPRGNRSWDQTSNSNIWVRVKAQVSNVEGQVAAHLQHSPGEDQGREPELKCSSWARWGTPSKPPPQLPLSSFHSSLIQSQSRIPPELSWSPGGQSAKCVCDVGGRGKRGFIPGPNVVTRCS